MNLCPATLADADFLFRLRNDPETVRASKRQREVTHEEHEAWLAQILSDPTRSLYIAEVDHGLVGTGRLERTLSGDWAKISLTIAPECRGQGHGTALVAKLVEIARSAGLSGVVADVRWENAASRRAFDANGFRPESRFLRLQRQVGAL